MPLLLRTPFETTDGWWATSTLGLLLVNAGMSGDPPNWWAPPGEPGADWLALISRAKYEACGGARPGGMAIMVAGGCRGELGAPSGPMPSGTGLGSRDSESGVTRPLCAPWLGDAGADLEEAKGVRKQGSPRCRRLRNACSTNLTSDWGSMRQKEPLPGSSCDRGTLTKYRFRLRLCRIEFCHPLSAVR